MEHPLHLTVVEGDPLDLTTLVFVVERHRLAGRCTENNRTNQNPQLNHSVAFYLPLEPKHPLGMKSELLSSPD